MLGLPLLSIGYPYYSCRLLVIAFGASCLNIVYMTCLRESHICEGANTVLRNSVRIGPAARSRASALNFLNAESL